MKNIGKIFEEQWKKSVPDHTLLFRLPDAAQSFGGGSGLRFSLKNPFDFLMWDSRVRILYALEMKTVKGKSISFERDKTKTREIHLHQIEGLNYWNHYGGIVCGFIIEFREIETTIFLDIDSFNILSNSIDKQSFNIKDLDNNNIPYYVIEQKRARTRYTYDVESFLNYCASLK